MIRAWTGTILANGAVNLGCTVTGAGTRTAAKSAAGNCMYEDCNKTHGYCVHGCVNGTDGPFCENICPSGKHVQ